MALSFFQIFCLLIVGHAVCDYPLQGDFLAKGKNHRNPIPGVPWWQCLLAHSVIHGGMVGLITGSVWLGLAEFLFHALIDFGKSHGAYGFSVDQWLHLGCKVLWACLIWGLV